MSEDRQNTTLSAADKEMADMDDISDGLISGIMEQTAVNLDELLQSICRWDSEERAMSEGNDESSADSYTQQKVQQHLEKFFAMRRVFAEHRADKENEATYSGDSETEISHAATAMDKDVRTRQSTSKEKKPVTKRFFKRIKFALKSGFGKMHSKKDEDTSDEEEEDEEDTMGKETDSRSKEEIEETKAEEKITKSLTQPEKEEEYVSQVTEQDIRTQESIDNEATAEKPAKMKFFKSLKTTLKKGFSKKTNPVNLEAEEDDATVEQQTSVGSEHLFIEDFEETKADEPITRGVIQSDISEKDEKEEEKENVQEREEVRIPETGSSSRLSTRSQESEEAASSDSSSFTTSTINEELTMTISQLTEQDIRTQESIDNESKTERPTKKKFFKELKTALKKGFSKKMTPLDVEAEEEDDTVEQQTSVGLEKVFTEDFDTKADEQETDIQPDISGKGEEEDKEETQADEQVVEIQSDISKKDEKEEEKENVQEREEVRIPETGSSSRLSTRSQESEEAASSDSSSFTTSTINEEPTMTISQVTEQDIRTQESIDNEATAEKPAKMKFFKSLKTTLKKGFSKKTNPVDVEAEEDDATVEQQTSVCLEHLFIEDFEETKADEPITKGIIQSDISEKDEKEEEKENVQEREEVRIPETGSSSRLSTRSQESEEAASSDSSSFTTSTINEELTMTISQLTEQDIRTQETIDNEATAEKPTKKKFFKSLKSTLKKGFSKKTNPVDLEAEEDDATVEQPSSVGSEHLFIEDFEETKADEPITKGVIQSDISEKAEKEEEKENVQEREEVRIPETGSSSRLFTRSQESEEEALSASSSSSTRAIKEEANVTISQVTEQDIPTQELSDNEATAEKPTKMTFFKSLKTTLKKGFSKNMNPEDVEAEEDDATVEQPSSVGPEQLFNDDVDTKAGEQETDIQSHIFKKEEEEGKEETKADEQITESLIQPGISEKEEGKEDIQKRAEVKIPETGSSSRLSTRSQESEEAASSAYSSFTTSTINEEPNTTISQVTEQDIRTQESIDNEATAEKPTKMTFFKSLKTTLKKGFSKNMNPEDVEAEEDDATVEQPSSVGPEQLFNDDVDTKAGEQETDIQSHIFKKEEEEGKEETKADEQITESLIQPGISEKEEGKEDIQKRAEVKIPETGSSSRLSTRSQESEEAASSAYSSFTTSTINEEPNTTISQVTEQDIRTQESIDNEATAEKPTKMTFFKSLKTTLKKGFSKNMNPEDVEAEEDDATVEQPSSVGPEQLFNDDVDTKAGEQETDIQSHIFKKEEEEGKEETKADEQITESLIQPGISEKEEGKEDIQKRAEVKIPETGSSSRLSTRSQESEEAASSAYSSFTTSTINEEPNTTISQVTEQDIRTQESIDNEATAEKPTKMTFFKSLKTTLKKGFSKNMNPEDVEAEQDDATVEQPSSVGPEQLFNDDFDIKADEQETDIQSHIFKKGEEEEGKEETKADEQITESLIQPGISEKEEGKENIQKVRIPETGSSSRLSTRSQESEEAASSDSSSFTTSTINEEPNTTISQVTEQDIRTQEAIDNESKTEKPAKKKFFKELKTALKKGFSKKMTPLDVEAEEEDDTVEQQTSVGLEKVLTEDFDRLKADEQETNIQPDISGKGEEEDKEETQADEQVVEIQSDISKKGEEGEEKEDIQEREKVRIPETGSSSRLSTRSQESEEEASSASSSTTSSIDEEPNMTISQVTEQDVMTQESINSDAKTEKPAKNKFFKRVKKDWKKCFSKKTALVSQSHEDEAPGSNLTCSPVKDQKEQYEAPAEQTSFALEQQFTEPLEERCAEAEDDLVMEIHSASSSEEDGSAEFSQGDNEAAADQTPVPNMSPVIRRFFQSLTDEQWREVSEGVYNRDVKEKLIDMCVDVLKFISDSVIRNVLRSLSQLSTTSRTAILKSPISSEHLKKFFNYDVQSSVESSFSQAVSDTIGADIPVSISPDFTEAIATEALDVVNPVLSVAIKASVVKGSSSAVAPAMSKNRAAKNTLAGAIKTMKSILTGRGSLVKKRVLKQKTPEPHTEMEEPVWISFSARPMTQDSPSPLTSSTRKDLPLSEATTDEVCSTTSKKKKKETKQPLCMRLFCCCCCCCHDDDE